MRATIFATMGLLACLGLAGCDNSANAPPTNAQATAQPCNCQPQSAAAAQTAAPRATHRHARVASYREYEEHYSYRSQSRSYYQSASDDQDAYDDQGASGGNAEGNVWVDGYGRSHYAVTASAAPTPDDRARLYPWHGYDAKCDEKK